MEKWTMIMNEEGRGYIYRWLENRAIAHMRVDIGRHKYEISEKVILAELKRQKSAEEILRTL